MNASNETCALGFAWWCATGPGNRTRERVNLYLGRLGREPVSKKTCDYYRREHAAGLTTWVPINQFSVLLEMQKTLATMGAS